jgi:hypothetical protein
MNEPCVFNAGKLCAHAVLSHSILYCGMGEKSKQGIVNVVSKMKACPVSEDKR